MNNIHNDVFEALSILSESDRIPKMKTVFSIKEGGYGQGDSVIGVTVPNIRKVAKSLSKEVSLEDIEKLIVSKYHDIRFLSLVLMIERYDKNKDERKHIVDMYLKFTKYINNWDLVDLSSHKIVGRYSYDNNDKELLKNLSLSEDMWEKRIAVVGSWYWINKNKLDFTKELILNNINHSHDLMHKANGWMLREIGKRDEKEMIDFIKKYYNIMPRTTLRYAIEKLDKPYYYELLNLNKNK